MSKLLDKAIAEVRKLPTEEQERIGAIILDELADEDRWSRSFADSQPMLDALADEALAEHRAGRTTPLDFKRRK